MDFKNMGAKRVCVVTDSNVAKLHAMRQVVEGLDKEGVGFIVYDKTQVEPKDSSYVHGRVWRRKRLNNAQDSRSDRLREAVPA